MGNYEAVNRRIRFMSGATAGAMVTGNLNYYDASNDTWRGQYSDREGTIISKREQTETDEVQVVQQYFVKGLFHYQPGVNDERAIRPAGTPFVFAGEDENALRAVFAKRKEASAGGQPNTQPGSEETEQEQGATTQPLPPQPAPVEQPQPDAKPEPQFDPADTNRDGVVSPKEQKKFDRQK